MKHRAKTAAHRPARPHRRFGVPALLGALVVLAAPAGAQDAAAPFDRLFFTAEQRSALDRQRQLDAQAVSADDATLTIDGVALRSNGRRTVWIDGIAHDETPEAALVTPDRRDPGQVVVRGTGKVAIKARVGDRVDRASGETSGTLGGGSLIIRRVAPAQTSR